MKTLVIATTNPGKVKEISRLLAGLSLNILSLADFPAIPQVEETGSTFTENAIIKARHAAKYTGEMSLADDSGLEVDALDGKPGIQSSRFAGPGATDAQRNKLLLSLLKDTPDEKRTARFHCVVAIASPSGETQIFDGVCEGLITREPRGAHGFGYDPVFFVPEYGKTMAELPPEVKNEISHRAKAVKASLCFGSFFGAEADSR
ncbi:MAG: XTP/dITP diphosphatase [Armatimonadota bacterium]|nr:XTP/dITP diphosphatase [Armatimonadota bacterium]